MQLRLFAFGLAMMIAGACAEAADRVVTVPCAEAGTLEFDVPEDWAVDISRHDARMPPTVTVAAPDGQAQWVVTAVWKAADRKPPATPDEIRARVRRTAETVGAAAAPLQATATGFYFDAGGSITPEPYTRLRQGMLRVGELTISFTAMSAEARAGDQQTAVERLSAARHRP
jgi:hypothetical protein